MFKSILVFFDRVKSMSFKRMFLLISQMSDEYNKSKVLLLIDILYCAFKYGVGYQDYRVFGFASLKRKDRLTFMTMNHNLHLAKTINDPEKRKIFSDKTLFFKNFSDYTKRNWLDLRKSNIADLERFIENKSEVFVKPVDLFGGQGVTKIKLDENTDPKVLFCELSAANQMILEDVIPQHEKMNSLYKDSLNTLRITTIAVDEKINIIYSVLRVGQGGSCVDNITSGGMYCPVNEKGIITKPAFCNKTGKCLTHHPETGVEFVGFEIPYYKETVDLILKAATLVPEVRYVGWDVGITPDGPVLVEGNHLPTYDLVQNYHHRYTNEGILKKVETLVGFTL